MKLLDLFCGAGGASMGYHLAGFEVVGVDINPQKRYPFEFHQADAMSFPLEGFDAIHASPPCQAYSQLKGLTTGDFQKLINSIRDRIIASGVPFYIIENVAGAKDVLINPIRLCGSSFGLGVWRHRFFEISWGELKPPVCQHDRCPLPLDVTGTGGPQKTARIKPGGGLSRKPKSMKQASAAMGIEWMTRKEIVESIPPAYTKWIGLQLIEMLRGTDKNN